MSRVGRLPITISDDVKVNISGLSVSVQGPKGELKKDFLGSISIKQVENQVFVKPLSDSSEARAMWGTARSIIANMVHGVLIGFTKELEVNGVGYRASVQGSFLNLALGKSHNTKIAIPAVISVTTPKQNIVFLQSIDKEMLGAFVALIKRQRPPEPYKGKGIKVKGEYIERREGKKA